MASDIALDKLIAITPGICGGKPRVAYRRMTVEDVALWHERLGLSADQIAIEFGLTLAQVHAALAYYFPIEMRSSNLSGTDNLSWTQFARPIRRW